MDNFLKQMRGRLAGLELENQEDASRRTPLQKTVSFKTEKKRFERQWSSDGGEITNTAVAAAAYAVTSLEEAEQMNNEKRNAGLEASMSKSKTRKEAQAGTLTDSARISRWLTGKEVKEDNSPGENMKQKAEMIGQRIPEKVPSVKKVVSFSDKNQNGLNVTTPKSRVPTPQKPKRLSPKTNGRVGTKADLWEQSRLAKINKQYEKMNNTILQWEEERKRTTRRRLERVERELERKRRRASQEYHNEIVRIEKVAGGARSIAKARKANEVSATREKANKYRETGKLPRACLCF